MPTVPAEIPSPRFGRYVLREHLGSGGMADVFRADAVSDSGAAQTVALKVAHSAAHADAFSDEADLMGVLEHPNLVRRLESGFTVSRPFIAMEFLAFGDLGHLFAAHRTQDRPFPRSLALHVSIELLKGLAYFHLAKSRSGAPLSLVHGDISPSNILFSAEGEVKLGDFGVAKSGSRDLGPKGTIPLGKLRYLAPERLDGEPPTSASDLFAVAVLLYEMTVGIHPFLNPPLQPPEFAQAMRAAKLKAPDSLGKAWQAVFKRGLAREPKARFQSAGELAGALLQLALDSGEQLSTADVRAHLWQLHGRR